MICGFCTIVVLYAKDGWLLGVYDNPTGRGSHLSWEENVEIRGDKYRSLSQITLPGSSVVLGTQAPPRRSASSRGWRHTRV